ncbi:hypothetical protein EW145_g4075 [Phellinidium pouzarii]|uniref:Uncharacterized protein n=1 Tax=Phellinidium pouzarii TaxID=167371 RepID=A0A4S4L513_9AGAM|nr:hypothetical protein EW145_g4075 [Phellinidium pouzarii]
MALLLNHDQVPVSPLQLQDNGPMLNMLTAALEAHLELTQSTNLDEVLSAHSFSENEESDIRSPSVYSEYDFPRPSCRLFDSESDSESGFVSGIALKSAELDGCWDHSSRGLSSPDIPQPNLNNIRARIASPPFGARRKHEEDSDSEQSEYGLFTAAPPPSPCIQPCVNYLETDIDSESDDDHIRVANASPQPQIEHIETYTPAQIELFDNFLTVPFAPCAGDRDIFDDTIGPFECPPSLSTPEVPPTLCFCGICARAWANATL